MSPLLEVVAAELPGNGSTSEDRVRVGTNAVVVLDGATGSDTRVSVNDYVDHLAGALVEVLDDEPDMPLPHALADAIRSTVGALRVMPGESPSSTVSIARRRGDEVDLLVLGDSPIYIGPDSQLLTDDRLAQLDLPAAPRPTSACGGRRLRRRPPRPRPRRPRRTAPVAQRTRRLLDRRSPT